MRLFINLLPIRTIKTFERLLRGGITFPQKGESLNLPSQ
ncbi:hypothetical protein VL20_2395 [Microcystis panniformis FACHB-1757]|uniref:Uncharacterized protein n=1 Tax=Microcystis panniformis FACHB-1757 TaxID=1638788 RepID=A0A0K1S0A6_9CHRO|nr:hypothetical protein VL20_2395 [Microcystis panniformis FACHB-1757]